MGVLVRNIGSLRGTNILFCGHGLTFFTLRVNNSKTTHLLSSVAFFYGSIPAVNLLRLNTLRGSTQVLVIQESSPPPKVFNSLLFIFIRTSSPYNTSHYPEK